MGNTEGSTFEGSESDPAAVFASAVSLWQACHAVMLKDASLNLSECYNGIDELMREVMRIATQFEQWADRHIWFEALDDVWPYLLQDKFGQACLTILSPAELRQFDDEDCLRVALQLKLAVKLDNSLPVPVDVVGANPIVESAFQRFRIQTVRTSLEDDDIAPFVVDDDPFDTSFSRPYFGIYGVDEEGLLEHIADRPTYDEALSLVRKLAPGIDLPDSPTSQRNLKS
jgi:hypothetical protein